MVDAQCDFQFLKPILKTVATMDKRTREWRIKTFEGDLDTGYQMVFDEQRESQEKNLKQLEQLLNKAKKHGALLAQADG